MPTATPFTALGKGNGFTDCLSKIDVSTFNHVATLTLVQAMKLYWMWYGVTCNVSDEETSVSGVSFLTDNPNWQPKDVVCEDNRNATKSDEDVSTGRESSIRMKTPQPARFYNGNVGNEGNFIGYGITGTSSNEQLFDFSTDFGDVEYYYFSHLAPEEEQYWDTVDSVTISGIPLIRATFSGVYPDNVGTPTLDFFDPPA